MPRDMSIHGEVPGYPERHSFADRASLFDARVHRERQAGIAGYGGGNPAESIVLSGGYEDDEDLGDEIIYTGQGGNDPKTKKQVYDQELTKGNLALVRSLQSGVPVRVIRGWQHDSPWSPPLGYQYAGLYRVEDYWHETGKSGFRIWRYRLQKVKRELILRPADEAADKEGDKGVGSEEQARRSSITVSRLIRDSLLAKQVKQLHDFTCQVCGIRLETQVAPYGEAAHIRPLGRPHNGPDTAENLLCLCPNDHVLFDYGVLVVEDDLTIRGSKRRLRTVPGHPLNLAHIRYHREHYG